MFEAKAKQANSAAWMKPDNCLLWCRDLLNGVGQNETIMANNNSKKQSILELFKKAFNSKAKLECSTILNLLKKKKKYRNAMPVAKPQLNWKQHSKWLQWGKGHRRMDCGLVAPDIVSHMSELCICFANRVVLPMKNLSFNTIRLQVAASNGSTVKWLEDHGAIYVPPWPANPLDLNPVEKLCGVAKGRSTKACCSNVDELKQVTSRVWASLTLVECMKELIGFTCTPLPKKIFFAHFIFDNCFNGRWYIC